MMCYICRMSRNGIYKHFKSSRNNSEAFRHIISDFRYRKDSGQASYSSGMSSKLIVM